MCHTAAAGSFMFYCFTTACAVLFAGSSSTLVLFVSVIPEVRDIVDTVERDPGNYNNDVLLHRLVSTAGEDLLPDSPLHRFFVASFLVKCCITGGRICMKLKMCNFRPLPFVSLLVSPVLPGIPQCLAKRFTQVP